MSNGKKAVSGQQSQGRNRASLAGARQAVRDFIEGFLRDLEMMTKDLKESDLEEVRSSRTRTNQSDSSDENSVTPKFKKADTALGTAIFLKAFWGLLLRDTRVLTREFHVFLARVGMQPLLFLFVFTFILPHMGGGNPMAAAGGVDFGTILLPGLMAVAIMFSGIAAVALPLSSEFGITREIDDRVMSPLPLWAVALEKVSFSAVQSIIAALLVIPMAYFIPSTPVRAEIHNWFLLGLVLVLASLLAGSLGLVIGSTVNPRQIGLVFSIIVVPITFLGCVYYPWARLGAIPWVKYGVLFNPIVYMSEGLRAAVTPGVEHMPWWAILVALVFFVIALGRWGVKGFLGRVLS